jgi:hypothetical protein
MAKNITVDGCALKLQNGGSGDISITSTPSSKVKCDGKGVYTEIKFDISNYTGQAITVAKSGSGSGSITTTAVKCKAEGSLVFLEGDVSATITINGKAQSGQSQVPATATEIVKITNAGQSICKGV